MPLTWTEIPVLSGFLRSVKNTTGEPVMPEATQDAQSRQTQPAYDTSKPLPKGVVLGKDGKPCRSCTSVKSWMAMAEGRDTPDVKNPLSAMTSAAAAATLADDCPADVEALGRGSWTMLHTMTANYPEKPSTGDQEQAKTFISLFARLYPCGHCAEDFQHWMGEGNPPAVQSREDFGTWMCRAHNAVNEKLGKEKFDCGKWEERWRTGPSDGRCG